MTVINIRDLIHNNPPIEAARTQAEEKACVSLPGDSPEVYESKYSSLGPQGLLRLIRSGTLSPDDDREARRAIQVFESISGERVTGGLSRGGNPPVSRAQQRPVDTDVLENPDYDAGLSILW